MANLSGLVWTGPGELQTPDGLTSCAHNGTASLYAGLSPQRLARWPNVRSDGLPDWRFLTSVQKGPDGGWELGVNASEPLERGWAEEADPWLHGFIGFDWADNRLPIGAVTKAPSPGPDVAVLATRHGSTAPYYPPSTSNRWYGFNLLAELDQAGEYHIDRAASPPLLRWMRPAGAGPPVLSASQSAIDASATSAAAPLRHVVIAGVTVAHARGSAIVVGAGEDVSLVGVTVAASNSEGASLHGEGLAVVGSSVEDVGCSGVAISGGSLPLLATSGNLLHSTSMRRFSGWKRTYQPGLAWSDVGLVVARCTFADAPHSGVLGSGASTVVASSTFEGLAYETADAGGWYSGRSWARRNHTLANNTFRDIFDREPIPMEGRGCQAIHLDDELSGVDIVENRFESVYKGVQLGGGRHVRILNNTFTNVSLVAVHLDNRGMTFQHSSCVAGGKFQLELEALGYTHPPWSTAFPELQHIWQPGSGLRPCVPFADFARGNRYCTASGNFTSEPEPTIESWNSSFAGNVNTCP